MDCCCDSIVISAPPSVGMGEIALTCPTVNVLPVLTRLDGVGSVTVPANTALSVSVVVLTGPVDLQIGVDPVVSLPTGASVGWSVEACTQKLSADIVITNTAAGHSILVSKTI